MDVPLAHHYRGKDVFVKFDWQKPNDEAPTAAHVIAQCEVEVLGKVAVDLDGSWDDFQQAIADAVKAAEIGSIGSQTNCDTESEST